MTALTITARLRPHTEQPLMNGETAIIVSTKDSAGIDNAALLLSGIYLWRSGSWINERTGEELSESTYHWIAESDLTAPLEPITNGAPA